MCPYVEYRWLLDMMAIDECQSIGMQWRYSAHTFEQ